MSHRVRKGKGPMWAKADCTTCGWELEAANAQAVGARHAAAHGHYVMVAVERDFRYDGTGKEPVR